MLYWRASSQRLMRSLFFDPRDSTDLAAAEEVVLLPDPVHLSTIRTGFPFTQSLGTVYEWIAALLLPPSHNGVPEPSIFRYWYENCSPAGNSKVRDQRGLSLV